MTLTLGVSEADDVTQEPCNLQARLAQAIEPLQQNKPLFRGLKADFSVLKSRLKITLRRNEDVLAERFVEYDSSACVPTNDYLETVLKSFFKDFVKTSPNIPTPVARRPQIQEKEKHRETQVDTSTATEEIVNSTTNALGTFYLAVFAQTDTYIRSFEPRLGGRARIGYRIKNAELLARLGIIQPLRASTDNSSWSALPFQYSLGGGFCSSPFDARLCLYGILGREHFLTSYFSNHPQEHQWHLEGLIEYQRLVTNKASFNFGFAIGFRPENQAVTDGKSEEVLELSGWTANTYLGISFELF